jgi:hypothetical protein
MTVKTMTIQKKDGQAILMKVMEGLYLLACDTIDFVHVY